METKKKAELLTMMMKEEEEEIEMEKKTLPPDEQRCSYNNGSTWRCKNFKRGLGAAAAAEDENGVPKSRLCEKHYNHRVKSYLKKRSGAGCSATGPIESRVSKRRRKVTEEEDNGSLDVTGGIQPATSDAIIERGTANIRRKRENVEMTEGCRELESLTRTWEPVVKSKSTLVHYKSKCFELSLELDKKNVELEKKKIECTKLQGQLAEVLPTNKSAATEETERTPADATQCWRKMFSDLESRVLKVENENSTMRCVVSNLESLVQRNGKESSIMRSVDLRGSVMIESEARGLQNDVTQSVEKQRDETCCGGREYSRVYKLKTKEEVLNKYENVEQGKGWGCSEEMPSQLGSSSGDHLEMSKKPSVNLVSDDDSVEILGESGDSDSSDDTETSLGSLMDILAMKYRNRKEDQDIKWKFEADMVSSFEEDPELNMKAVCALYRQHIAEVEISTKGLLHYSDAPRATTLAKFLTDGACKGDLKKSVKELEKVDSEGVEDCKRLARSYSKQLFSIYQNKKDPFFLPSTTASNGDLTSK